MISAELNSFILKFKQLSQAGLDAHLAVDSKAGNVWVHLHVPLGQALRPAHEVQPSKIRKRNSPSRQRRHARREAARVEKTAGTNETERVNTVVEESLAEEANISPFNTVENVNDAAEAPKKRSIEEIAVEAVIDQENEIDDFECGFCGLECLNEPCLEHHMYAMHADVFRSSETEESDESEIDESEASEAGESEECEEPEVSKEPGPNVEYSCGNCKKTFKNSGQLRRHKKSNHEK